MIRHLFFSFLAVTLVNYGWAAAPAIKRRPQSYYQNILQSLDQIQEDISNPRRFHRGNAFDYIDSFLNTAYDLKQSDILPANDFEKTDFERRSKDLVELLFDIQLKLRKKMTEFSADSELSEREVSVFRRAFMYLRYAQDYAIEEWARKGDFEKQSEILKGTAPLVLLNPKFKNLKIQSGDIFLIRGTSFASASIARVGDIPTNMSHIAIVGHDEKGELYVMESLFEKGTTYYKLKDYLNLERLPRVMLLRFKHPSLGKRAGGIAYQIVHQAHKKGLPLPFDIGMDSANHERVYCAELAKISYERASEGKLSIPQYMTSFQRAQDHGSFLKGMGIYVRKSFAPTDLDVDPRFEVVAEYRDLGLLAESRMYDVALSSLFKKMESGFDYKWSLQSARDAVLAVLLRQFGYKADVIPKDVPILTMQTMIQQKEIVERIMTHLKKVTQAHQIQHGRGLAYIEMEKIVDEYLEENKSVLFISKKSKAKSAPQMCKQIFL